MLITNASCCEDSPKVPRYILSNLLLHNGLVQLA